MTRRRVFVPLAIASAAIGVAGTSLLPIASADTLPNGLTVSCNQDSEQQVTCIIGGCPRVNGDYVVDAVHVLHYGDQDEYDFKCINGQTARYVVNPQTLPDWTIRIGIQGCRKNTFSADWCGQWADYTYTPPVAAAQHGAPANPAAPPPAPAPAPAALPVHCTVGGYTLPPGSDCSKTPNPNPPPVEAPPTNAISISFQRQGLFQVVATITNSSKMSGQCDYDAEDVNGLLPGRTDNFPIGANASVNRTYPAPPPLSTYNATVKCHGDFNGQDVQFGSASQQVSG